MEWLTLNRIKEQCRIEPDFHDEDEILLFYGESVEQQVLIDTGRTVAELKAMGDGEHVPTNIVHASLLLVDSAYKQRSAIDTMSWSVVPYAYEHKIKPYIKLAD